MSTILMPINPKYVNEILTGRKKYEYRKIKPKRKNIEKMIIYSTFPVKKVVAEVEIKGILEENPKQLWQMTKNESGITKDIYDKYYEGRDVAIAYKLGKPKIYDKPLNLKDLKKSHAPQSFAYLD